MLQPREPSLQLYEKNVATVTTPVVTSELPRSAILSSDSPAL